MAQAYAVLGDKVSALHMLRHSIEGGFFCYPYFEHDPLLQNLRDEPEFQSLMSRPASDTNSSRPRSSEGDCSLGFTNSRAILTPKCLLLRHFPLLIDL